MFLSGGEVIGEFVFAVAITVLIAVLLDRLSVEGLLDDDDIEDDEIAAALVRNELLLVSGRLTVGWAWGQLVSSAVGLVVPVYDGNHMWADVISKFAAAIAVFVLGAVADIYLRKIKRKLSLQQPSEKSPTGSYSSSGSFNGSGSPTNLNMKSFNAHAPNAFLPSDPFEDPDESEYRNIMRKPLLEAVL